MSDSWKRHVEVTREYTVEDQMKDVQDRINLKHNAISHLESTKRLVGSNVRDIDRKIKGLTLKLETLERELKQLQRSANNTASMSAGAVEDVVTNEMETSDEDAAQMEEEASPEVDAVTELALADWGPAEEAAATEMVSGLSTDEKVEMKTELEGEGMPVEGAPEVEGNMYKFVRIYVETLLPENYIPSERGLSGFSDRNEFVNFCIDVIEKDPTLLLVVSDRMRKNKSLSKVLRLIAKVSTM